MPRLIAQSEEFAGTTFELAGDRLTLGRVPDNDLQLEHNSVSGHHAEIVLDELDYRVKDLDSTNGTRVNGERITEQKLRRNDLVRFGNIELLYDSEHAPPANPMPEPSRWPAVEGTTSSGRPATFTNNSPFPVKGASLSAKSPWTLVFAGLAVLALGGLGYFIYAVFVAPGG